MSAMRMWTWRVAVGTVVCAVGVTSAIAAPITLVPGTINMFRDTRGINDVGIAQGDLLQFGADVQGGSLGTSLGATYPPTGFTRSQFPCSPLAVNANFCSRSTTFTTTRIAQPWNLKFTNGPDTLIVAGPSLAGTENAVPFPLNVTIANSGLTPTINWTVPNTFAPDGFRVNIYDKSLTTVGGFADLIHSDPVAANATSYTIPSILDAGNLALGGNYSINFQVIETRGHVAFTGNNAQILRRSSSFFSFSPLDNSAPPNVYLPQIGIDTNPNDNRAAPYEFFITNVGPNSVTFIDPLLATGYDYAIGAGDPNFASVLLPDIGDGIYELSFLLGGITQTSSLEHDVQFFFPTGGVDAFSVRGIEIAAGLDPADATAFITGLTFVTTGDFTGTMTPITQFVSDAAVSEPGTFLLIGVGLGALAYRRRRAA